MDFEKRLEQARIQGEIERARKDGEDIRAAIGMILGIAIALFIF